ncbi:MAG: trypsin-like serine peptidase [Chloroflexota bacterium]
MRLSRSRLVLATVTVLTVLPLAAASTMARDGGHSEHDRIVSYWTRDRIANAVPRDFVKSGANDLASPKGNAKPTTGGGIKGASWTGDQTVVKRTGKVFFSMGGGNWICSGTVVNDNARPGYSMVLTAGHCAIDEKTGIFATNWMFIPAFDTVPTYTCANSAYGCWTATALVVRNEFATAGAFNTQAITNDWALAVVGSGGNTNGQLDTTVGDYPIAFDGVTKGNTLDAFGYPAGGKYHGSDLIYCEGAIGTDARMGNATWGMPCDMTGGSSGGPWLKGFSAAGGGTLSSLNSYGYSGSAVMYGPVFNSRTQTTYNAALDATSSNLKVTGS